MPSPALRRLVVDAPRPVRNLLLFGRLRSPIPFASPEVRAAVGAFPVHLPPPAQIGPGCLDTLSLSHLLSLGQALGAREVLEIGTATGLTTLALARNLPAATVHTLDLPPGGTPALKLGSMDHGLANAEVPRLYEGTPEAARVVQLLGDSATFDFRATGRAFDLVFIDGAHSFEYVESDTRKALEVLSDGPAALVWDDYWQLAPGVVRFLDRVWRERRLPGLFRYPDTRLVAWLNPAARARFGLQAASPTSR